MNTQQSENISEVERRLQRLEQEVAIIRGEIGQFAQEVASFFRFSAACMVEYDFTVTDSSTGNPLAGATTNVLDGTAVVATGTTDANGKSVVRVYYSSTFTYSVSDTGHATATGSLSSGCGSIVAVAVALAASGVHAPNICPSRDVPLSWTLHSNFVTGVDRTITMTWDGSSKWTGCGTFNAPSTIGGGVTCPAVTTPEFYECDINGNLTRKLFTSGSCYASGNCGSTPNVSQGPYAGTGSCGGSSFRIDWSTGTWTTYATAPWT